MQQNNKEYSIYKFYAKLSEIFPAHSFYYISQYCHFRGIIIVEQFCDQIFKEELFSGKYVRTEALCSATRCCSVRSMYFIRLSRR